MPGTPPPPTPEQQKLIERITAQRERLRDGRRRTPSDGIDPADPLVLRLWRFAQLHPAVAAAAVAAMALAGPRRLSRWLAVVLPIVLQRRR